MRIRLGAESDVGGPAKARPAARSVAAARMSRSAALRPPALPLSCRDVANGKPIDPDELTRLREKARKFTSLTAASSASDLSRSMKSITDMTKSMDLITGMAKTADSLKAMTEPMSVFNSIMKPPDLAPRTRPPLPDVSNTIAKVEALKREAQADLIVSPLREVLERQHATVGQLADVMQDQARQLHDEREKRAAAELAEAAAVRNERRKNTALVVMTLVLVALTLALLYVGLNPPSATPAKPKGVHAAQRPGHRALAPMLSPAASKPLRG